MGPGIFTTHWKKVLGGCLGLLMAFLAVVLYYEFRSPIGRASPHERVNNLYEWEYMTFCTAQETYSADTEEINLYFRNDAPDGVVWLAAVGPSFAYDLEIWQNDGWHQMRSHTEQPRWEGKTDIVNWAGGEAELSCPVARDYGSPLPAGNYRIVIPECEHMNRARTALAVEFEVLS
jgi:hypothetical protein